MAGNKQRTRNKNKKKGSARPSTAPAVKQAKRKSTPFADTGAVIGRSIGGMFGNSKIGHGVGRWLGTGIGSIFGSGDYQMAGASPKYNALTAGNQIPKFSTTHQTNIVCHREYLGDFTGTTAFSNIQFPLNPGVSKTFPWLSTVAENYQEYKFHGLVFEFRSLITDFIPSGAPGVVIMSTNYNADAPVYQNKQQMENAEFAMSCKPTVNLIHGVECAMQQTVLPQLYVRTGSVPNNQDLRLYDQGTFQFATQANPAGQDLGELWVSYCVEFFKPILPTTSANGGGAVDHFICTPVATTIFGNLSKTPLNQIGTFLANSASLVFPAFAEGTFTVKIYFSGGSSVVSAVPTPTVPANVTIQGNNWFNQASTFAQVPQALTATGLYWEGVFVINPVSTTSTLFWGTTTAPVGGFIDVIVTQVTSSYA
jgi:hypothetical protein